MLAWLSVRCCVLGTAFASVYAGMHECVPACLRVCVCVLLLSQIEQTCLEEYEVRKREDGAPALSPPASASSGSSSNRSRSTSPRGSTFRRTISDKRRALDSATRGSRIVHRDEDMLQFMQSQDGPNLMQALQQRYASRHATRVFRVCVRACARVCCVRALLEGQGLEVLC
jgi:hypothetical protein